MSRQRNRIRITLRLRPENYLAVMAATTPQNGATGFGNLSDFFDHLVDHWRHRQAQQINQTPSQGEGS